MTDCYDYNLNFYINCKDNKYLHKFTNKVINMNLKRISPDSLLQLICQNFHNFKMQLGILAGILHIYF